MTIRRDIGKCTLYIILRKILRGIQIYRLKAPRAYRIRLNLLACLCNRVSMKNLGKKPFDAARFWAKSCVAQLVIRPPLNVRVGVRTLQRSFIFYIPHKLNQNSCSS